MVSRTGLSSEESLLESATRVFLESGFSGARVDEIARRAGINKAMIYYHFRSKRGLYQAVLLRLFRGVLDEIERLSQDQADPRRRLITFYAGVARIFSERPALPHLMLREVISGGERMDSETAKTLARILGFVRKAVEQGVREGSMRRVHPLLVHLSALAPLILFFTTQTFRNRLLPSAAPELSMPSPEELLDHLALMIERGLEPVAPTKAS